MNNKKSALAGFVIGMATCALPSIGGCLFFPSARQALPFRAVNIKEVESISGFLPDFSYKLEADNITQDEFDRFARRMGFPDASRQNARLYVIDEPEREYHKKAEYLGGTLYFEEVKY
ncbi:MAG: hypothetical protein JWP89_3634 [Schlesneria sp.]|nr:hypothetical protein [Schlesneria sp.]